MLLDWAEYELSPFHTLDMFKFLSLNKTLSTTLPWPDISNDLGLSVKNSYYIIGQPWCYVIGLMALLHYGTKSYYVISLMVYYIIIMLLNFIKL